MACIALVNGVEALFGTALPQQTLRHDAGSSSTHSASELHTLPPGGLAAVTAEPRAAAACARTCRQSCSDNGAPLGASSTVFFRQPAELVHRATVTAARHRVRREIILGRELSVSPLHDQQTFPLSCRGAIHVIMQRLLRSGFSGIFRGKRCRYLGER